MDISIVPELFNNYLFDGNSLAMAKVLLCALIVFVTAIPILILSKSIQILMVIEMLFIILLTGLGWLDISIMIIIVLLIALILSKKAVTLFTSNEEI